MLYEDTSVCGHLDFHCLKLKYIVNHDIQLLTLREPITTVADLDVANFAISFLIFERNKA